MIPTMDGFYWVISNAHEDWEIVELQKGKVWATGIEDPLAPEDFTWGDGPLVRRQD
jgi:hypothetical protein